MRQKKTMNRRLETRDFGVDVEDVDDMGAEIPDLDDSHGDVNIHQTKMNSIIIERSVSDEDDLLRSVAPWDSKIEDQIRKWKLECQNLSTSHNDKAKYFKKLYYFFSLMIAILSITITLFESVDIYLGKTPTLIFLLIISFLNVCNTLIIPGQRSERHFSFASNYYEVQLEITSELIKPRKHLIDAEIFLQKTMDKYNSLNVRAPHL